MTIQEINNLLKDYPNERIRSAKSVNVMNEYYVCFKLKGEDNEYYTLNKDGTILKHTFTDEGDEMVPNTLSMDMESDKYEIYSPLQIYRSGYILLEEDLVPADVITGVYNLVARCEGTDILSGNPGKQETPIFYAGLATDAEIKVHVPGDTEIRFRLTTVDNLTKENSARKHYGLRFVPFITSMEKNRCIHVSTIYERNKKDISSLYVDCNIALKYLRSYLEYIKVPYKYVGCKMRYPVYY